MSTPHSDLTVSWHTDISEIDRDEWNRLTKRMDTPILDYEWLLQMERSGSVAPEVGWLPCHLALHDAERIVAVAPLYIKGHSQGEFVWDYMWADVASQLSVSYYPKLIGMSPATPAVGYRFLIDPERDEAATTRYMLELIDAFCEANSLSGSSFHFVDPAWGAILPSLGYTGWFHQSFEWYNTGFADFDAYLDGFTKNQRRNIRRERRSIADQGLIVRTYTDEQIDEEQLEVMWEYYERTNDQFGPWAAKYLTRDFFDSGLLAFRDRMLLIAAFEGASGVRQGRPVAMSMLLSGDDVIVGRYWGAERTWNNLHFELCYYEPISWAIEHRIARFDPGAGSPHKLRRGFLAVGNYSYHRFRDTRLRSVMEEHISEINGMEQSRIEEMNRSVPLKSLPDVPRSLAGVSPVHW